MLILKINIKSIALVFFIFSPFFLLILLTRSGAMNRSAKKIFLFNLMHTARGNQIRLSF